MGDAAPDNDENDWLQGFMRRVDELLAEQHDWFEAGLQESPEEFFRARAPWLASAESVQVVTNSDGHHDIMIRVDGSYLDEGEAHDIAGLLQAKIYGYLARLQSESGDA